jgi:peptidoglycan/xylan/chitin deacetylase (PgdA/CDA1 family)
MTAEQARLTRRSVLGLASLVVTACSAPSGGRVDASASLSTTQPTTPATPTPKPSASPTSATPSVLASPTPRGPALAPPSWAVAGVPSRASIVAEYADRAPKQWGLDVTGVVARLAQPAGVALTFDACGGRGGGSGFDERLITLLRDHKVPATLFLNQRWISANPSIAAELAADPLFEIESHGVRHLPLSVSGRSAYGIAGTRNVGQAYDEVVAANAWFQATLGRLPWFFRPGTAYADEVAVAMSRQVGQVVAGFSVNGDAGATFSPGQVAATVATVRAGDIVISHMNRPTHGTAAGYATALPRLLDRGVKFVRLREGF